MEGLTEYRMKVHEDGPRVRVFIEIGSDGRVDVKSERYIVDHDEQVGDGEPCEYRVGGRGHFLAAEHSNVNGVSGGAEQADDERDVAVHTNVHVLEGLPARHAVRHALRARRLARHLALLYRTLLLHTHHLKQYKTNCIHLSYP